MTLLPVPTLPDRLSIVRSVLDQLTRGGATDRAYGGAFVLATLHTVATVLDDHGRDLDAYLTHAPEPKPGRLVERTDAYAEVAAWLDPLDDED